MVLDTPPLIEGRFRHLIGQPRDAPPTPALILDLAAVQANIATMAAHLSGPTKLRPHAKSHKSAQIAHMQIAAGAIGMTAATVWEATALVQAGINDILIANEVVGATKLRQLAKLATQARLTVAVDSADHARQLAVAAAEAGSVVAVLIDVDIGLGRCGVRDEHAALALAEQIARLPNVQLRGVMGYEGHCALEPDRAKRSAMVAAAVARLVAAADMLRVRNFPVEVVSSGGTGTYDLTGAYAQITEIQAGSYVFMDAARTAFLPGFALGLTLLATVISRHGTTVVLDCGKKTASVDLGLPHVLGHAASVRYVSEEHTVLDVSTDSALAIGDRVELMTGYCPTTINLHDVYFVANGQTIIDVWPIFAQGGGQRVIEA